MAARPREPSSREPENHPDCAFPGDCSEGPEQQINGPVAVLLLGISYEFTNTVGDQREMIMRLANVDDAGAQPFAIGGNDDRHL
jgi:hypothetical protein